ncbi:MAG: hypothetical protein ACYTG2_17730 [Planctomycetota bacterium]|jgi:hypothetical protein
MTSAIDHVSEDAPPSGHVTTRARGPGALARAATLVAFVWGAFWMTRFRIQDYGGYPALEDIGTSPMATFRFALAVWVLPMALVLGFRRRPRRWVRSVVLICAASALFAEGWAGLEEAFWRREAPALAEHAAIKDLADVPVGMRDNHWANGQSVCRSRWWPFTHSGLYYEPRTGVFGGHD